jgi:hypothetical protein
MGRQMTVGAGEPGAGSIRNGGRPSAMTDEMRALVKPLLEARVRAQAIARQVGLDTSMIYKYRESYWQPSQRAQQACPRSDEGEA